MILQENNIFSNGKLYKHYLDFHFETNNVSFYLMFNDDNQFFVDYNDNNFEEIISKKNQFINISHNYENNSNYVSVKYDNYNIIGLNLSNQFIKKIRLDGMNTLLYLNCSDNLLTYLYLNNLKNIEEVIAHNNKLNDIEIINNNLKYLDLSNNLIETIDLSYIIYGKIVDLSYNNISELILPENCNFIKLSHNNISDFNKISFNSNGYYENLDISYNNMQLSVVNIDNLQNVNFSSNQLVNLTFSSKRLKNIILKDNKIRVLSAVNSKNIFLLDLRNNDIRDFNYINRNNFDPNGYIIIYNQNNFVDFSSKLNTVSCNVLYDMENAVRVAFEKKYSNKFLLNLKLKIRDFNSSNNYSEKLSLFVNNKFYGIDINYSNNFSYEKSIDSNDLIFDANNSDDIININIEIDLTNMFEIFLINMKISDNLLLDTFDVRNNSNKLHYFSNISFNNVVDNKTNDDIYLEIKNMIKNSAYIRMK